MGIRAITADDRAVWTPLWTGYLTFYETVLPQRVYDETWRRLLDPAEPVWGALALDDAGTPVGLVQGPRGRCGPALLEHARDQCDGAQAL